MCSVADNRSVLCCQTSDIELQPPTSPRDNRGRPGPFPPSHCPINRCGSPGTSGQPSACLCPSQGLTGALVGLLAGWWAGRPSGQSAPQSPQCWWAQPAPSAACHKEPGGTEEVQISSNGLDPDGCAHDNRPPCLWWPVSGQHRGHHNDSAELCMQAHEPLTC